LASEANTNMPLLNPATLLDVITLSVAADKEEVTTAIPKFSKPRGQRERVVMTSESSLLLLDPPRRTPTQAAWLMVKDRRWLEWVSSSAIPYATTTRFRFVSKMWFTPRVTRMPNAQFVIVPLVTRTSD